GLNGRRTRNSAPGQVRHVGDAATIIIDTEVRATDDAAVGHSDGVRGQSVKDGDSARTRRLNQAGTVHRNVASGRLDGDTASTIRADNAGVADDVEITEDRTDGNAIR